MLVAARNSESANGFTGLDDADGSAVPAISTAIGVVALDGDVAAAASTVGTAAHGAHCGHFVTAVDGDAEGVAGGGFKVGNGVGHLRGGANQRVVVAIDDVDVVVVDSVGVAPGQSDAVGGGQAVVNRQVADRQTGGRLTQQEADIVLHT